VVVVLNPVSISALRTYLPTGGNSPITFSVLTLLSKLTPDSSVILTIFFFFAFIIFGRLVYLRSFGRQSVVITIGSCDLTVSVQPIDYHWIPSLTLPFLIPRHLLSLN
jgi:hypothetical protein